MNEIMFLRFFSIMAFSCLLVSTPCLAVDKCTKEMQNNVKFALSKITPGHAFDARHAIKLLDGAIQVGNVDAMYNMGLIYMKGLGVKKNDGVAKKNFKNAAECGHTIAQFNLAQILFDESNTKEAARWFLAASEKGHTISTYNAGLLYAKGIGVKRDIALAKYYFHKAAEAGNVDAMYNYAYLNDDNGSYPVDLHTAFKYYLRAAQKNHSAGQSKVAVFYAMGYGVEKNINQSLYWLRKAAENGDNDAKATLRAITKADE